MEDSSNKTIEEISKGLKCQKDFVCCNVGCSKLCKAKDVGIESFLECLENKPESCQFSLSFGLMHLCQCPIRIYLYKKFNK